MGGQIAPAVIANNILINMSQRRAFGEPLSEADVMAEQSALIFLEGHMKVSNREQLIINHMLTLGLYDMVDGKVMLRNMEGVKIADLEG